MKPYRRHSLMAFRPLRRLLYRRGDGVHSPYAYYLIHDVIQRRYPYYATRLLEVRHREYPTLSMSVPPLPLRVGMLLYRLVARLGFSHVHFHFDQEEALGWDAPFYVALADSRAGRSLTSSRTEVLTRMGKDFPYTLPLETYRLGEEGRELLVTDSPSSLLSPPFSLLEGHYALVLGIRSTPQREKEWLRCQQEIPKGILLDMYECALVVGRSSHRYYYRTTL